MRSLSSKTLGLRVSSKPQAPEMLAQRPTNRLHEALRASSKPQRSKMLALGASSKPQEVENATSSLIRESLDHCTGPCFPSFFDVFEQPSNEHARRSVQELENASSSSLFEAPGARNAR